jgi:chaperonin GroES
MNTVLTHQKIEPLYDRVLVRMIEEPPTTKSGFLIPESARDRPVRGEVVAVGPGRFDYGRFVETTLKPGQIVLFGKFTGAEIIVDDDTLIVMGESEVIARFTEALIPEAH